MDLCFSTLCCLNDSLEQCIRYAVNNGMHGIEPRVNDKNETFGSLTIADAPQIRKAIADAGLAIPDLALSCFITDEDPRQLAVGQAGMDFAAALNAKAIRVFVGKHQERFSVPVETDKTGIIKNLQALSDYAESKKIEVWLETHSCFSSGQAMAELVGQADRENIKVLWDVAHTVEYHETPEETLCFLGNKISHVHVKDACPQEDADLTQYRHTDLGKGTLPIIEAVKLLEKSGFSGMISLEWESPWRPEIRDLYPDVNDLLKAFRRFVGQEQ